MLPVAVTRRRTMVKCAQGSGRPHLCARETQAHHQHRRQRQRRQEDDFILVSVTALAEEDEYVLLSAAVMAEEDDYALVCATATKNAPTRISSTPYGS